MSRLLTSIYYKVKPFLPWRFRMALRQWRAKRRRKAFAAVWPINPAAGTPPPGWPGWPRGAQFSLVLTHDVEGQKGYVRVPLLMEVEQKYGFRSSFNFVPKGEYQVDRHMLNILKNAGFEAGVHRPRIIRKALSIEREVCCESCTNPQYSAKLGMLRLPFTPDAASAWLASRDRE